MLVCKRCSCGGPHQQPFSDVNVQAIDVLETVIEELDCLDGLELVLRTELALDMKKRPAGARSPACQDSPAAVDPW